MASQEQSSQAAKPSHPGLIQTNLKPGHYSSYTTSLVALPAGSFFTSFEHATKVPLPTYATLQASKTEHLELNSDLLYTNHSCKPSLEFDMDKMEVRVARETDLNIGDKLTFFYPSTEWEMAQPFDCQCGERECLGRIDGAKSIDRQVLRRYWLSKHIRDLLEEQAA